MKKNYTLNEEIGNSSTHALGAILSIIALILLIQKASIQESFVLTLSLIIYALTMFLMFLSSSLYHAVPMQKLKSKLQTLDHCAIFLLIAGTYTPFTLVVLKGETGLILFTFIWVLAIIGVILNVISVAKFRKLSLFCYIAMGWAVLFAIKPLVDNLPTPGITLLTLGGVAYTVGVAFYVQKKKYMHTIWHLFVLLGGILHFLTIYLFIA